MIETAVSVLIRKELSTIKKKKEKISAVNTAAIECEHLKVFMFCMRQIMNANTDAIGTHFHARIGRMLSF